MSGKPRQAPLIGIVGPCGAGKTTLAQALQAQGYRAKAIAQEHSFAPHMWQRLTHPDLLIFLDVSHAVGAARRQFNWKISDWEEQQHRLRHARQHADLIIQTDNLNIAEVLEKVLSFLQDTLDEKPRA